jgi:hypothetical protein
MAKWSKTKTLKHPHPRVVGSNPCTPIYTYTSPTTPGSLPPLICVLSLYINHPLFCRFAMEMNASTYDYPENVPQHQPMYDPWTSENCIELGDDDYDDQIPELDIPETPPHETKRVVVRVVDAVNIVTQLRFPCSPGPSSDVLSSTSEVHSTVAATPDPKLEPGMWKKYIAQPFPCLYVTGYEEEDIKEKQPMLPAPVLRRLRCLEADHRQKLVWEEMDHRIWLGNRKRNHREFVHLTMRQNKRIDYECQMIRSRQMKRRKLQLEDKDDDM